MIFNRIKNAIRCFTCKRYELMEYSPIKEPNKVSANSHYVNVDKEEEIAIFASCHGKLLNGKEIHVTFLDEFEYLNRYDRK